MRTLLLNSPAGHASRAFIDQKTARPDQVPLLVDHHHLAETETFHQQASGAKNQKNSEQNAHYLLTIPYLDAWAGGHKGPYRIILWAAS